MTLNIVLIYDCFELLKKWPTSLEILSLPCSSRSMGLNSVQIFIILIIHTFKSYIRHHYLHVNDHVACHISIDVHINFKWHEHIIIS